MKTVACRMDLGMTRIAGYILFDPASLEFRETTPREVERLIKQNQINGLKFNEAGEVVPDLEGWNLGNLKIKSAVGNYRDWNLNNPKGDTVYSVVRAVDIPNVNNPDGSQLGRIFETINNRCGRVFYTKKQLLGLASFAWVGGIRVNQDDETIELCTGVQVENWEDKEVFELGTSVMSKGKVEEMSMEEMFNQYGASVDGVSAEATTDGMNLENGFDKLGEGFHTGAGFTEGQVEKGEETEQQEEEAPEAEQQETEQKDAEQQEDQEVPAAEAEQQEEETSSETTSEFSGEQLAENQDGEEAAEDQGEEVTENSDNTSESQQYNKSFKNRNHKKKNR